MNWWQYKIFKNGPSSKGSIIALVNSIIGFIAAFVFLFMEHPVIAVIALIYGVVWVAVSVEQIRGASKAATYDERRCPHCGESVFETVVDGGKQSVCKRCDKYIGM